MTKKDYLLISKVLGGHISDGAKCFDDEKDCRAIADSFADALQEDNTKFDRLKFLKACGVDKFPSYEDETLLCTHPDCYEPQAEDGEFCQFHLDNPDK